MTAGLSLAAFWRRCGKDSSTKLAPAAQRAARPRLAERRPSGD